MNLPGHTYCSSDAAMEQHSDSCQTRRQFCLRAATFAFGGAAGASLAGCSSPTGPGSEPNLPTVSGTRVASGINVTIDSNSSLSTVGNAALVQTSIGDFLLAHTAANTFIALTATCTHQTCTITQFGNQNYVCPCHGSTFDTSGRVVLGPANAPLRQYPTQFVNGVVTISA